MDVLALIIVAPLLLSLVNFLTPYKEGKAARRVTFVASVLVLGGAAHLLYSQPESWQLVFPPHFPVVLQRFSPFLLFSTQGFSGMMMFLFAVLMTVLAFFALAGNSRTLRGNHFFAWFWFTAGLGLALFSASHFYLMIFLWGVSAIPLFMLASGFGEARADLGKKTLILFGGAYVLMVTGAVMAVSLSGSAEIATMQTATSSVQGKVSLLLLLAGGLAATGIIPLHAWIHPYAKYADGWSFALMPLVFQRLAGTYLLIRLSQDVFVVGETLRIILFALGILSSLFALATGIAFAHPASRLAYFHVALGGMALAGIATVTQAGALISVLLVTAGAAAMMPFFLIRRQKGSRSVSLKWLPPAGQRLLAALNRLGATPYADIYELGSKAVFAMHRQLSRMHDGVLQTYLVWVVVAMIVLFLLK